jgi:5'-methylthioadenosine phosphorylase
MECKNAVIGGTGAYTLLGRGVFEFERLRPIHTPYGESQTIFMVNEEDVRFLFMSRHGEEDYDISAPYVNYQANIYALRELGVRNIIAWSGPGAINKDLKPGQYIIPDDLIDGTHGRKSSFFEGRGIGHMRQSPVFCPRLALALERSVKGLGYDYRSGGTYVCTQGPRLETPAEIKMYETLGGDIVGMVVAPECFLAKELEMCYIPLCYVSNYAEGVRMRKYKIGVPLEGLSTEDEQEQANRSLGNIPHIIMEFFKKLDEEETQCFCQYSMERHRKEGVVGQEWHDWFDKP